MKLRINKHIKNKKNSIPYQTLNLKNCPYCGCNKFIYCYSASTQKVHINNYDQKISFIASKTKPLIKGGVITKVVDNCFTNLNRETLCVNCQKKVSTVYFSMNYKLAKINSGRFSSINVGRREQLICK